MADCGIAPDMLIVIHARTIRSIAIRNAGARPRVRGAINRVISPMLELIIGRRPT